MPGIVTSTNEAGSVKTYRVVFTTTSTSLAINWVTGSTSTGNGPGNLAADKGIWVMFQNQSTAANVTIGGPSVVPNTQGIVLGPLTTSAAVNMPNNSVVFSAGSWSAIQLNDWYVASTSSVAAAVAQLVKGV